MKNNTFKHFCYFLLGWLIIGLSIMPAVNEINDDYNDYYERGEVKDGENSNR